MKTSLRALAIAAVLGVSAITGTAYAANPMVGGAAMYDNKDIIDNAVNSKDHTTLVAAVKAAGLVDTLSGKGPFTVFAPVNAAFEKLPAGTVDNLLKPENKKALVGVLTYHVVPGKVTAAQAMKVNSAKTINGESLNISTQGGTVMINDATVTKADIMCSNGVIHVIDTVLMPK